MTVEERIKLVIGSLVFEQCQAETKIEAIMTELHSYPAFKKKLKEQEEGQQVQAKVGATLEKPPEHEN